MQGVFVGCFDCEFGGEDVAEFCAVAVSSADDFFLVVVVVARRQEVAENQLGDVDLLFLREC